MTYYCQETSDKPVQRASLNEKLEAFKERASDAEKQENRREKGEGGNNVGIKIMLQK